MFEKALSFFLNHFLKKFIESECWDENVQVSECYPLPAICYMLLLSTIQSPPPLLLCGGAHARALAL
jgi:hypothetical protein